MIFLYILSALVLAYLGFLTIKNLVRFARRLTASKKAGILKVVVGWGIYLSEAIGIGFVILAIVRFSTVESYLSNARKYEQILETGDAVISGSDKIQHLSSSPTQSRAKIEAAIEELREYAALNLIWACNFTLWGVSEIVMGITSIIFITGEGIVTGNMKVPEPITAVFRDGDIEVDLKADLANKSRKSTMIFKGTPQNLAKFGRFIEWDEPDAAGQPAPPPDNINMPT